MFSTFEPDKRTRFKLNLSLRFGGLTTLGERKKPANSRLSIHAVCGFLPDPPK